MKVYFISVLLDLFLFGDKTVSLSLEHFTFCIKIFIYNYLWESHKISLMCAPKIFLNLICKFQYVYLFMEFFCLFVFCFLHWESCSIGTLSCGMWDLVPQPECEPKPTALGAWHFSQWSIREVPVYAIFNPQKILTFLFVGAQGWLLPNMP